MDSPAGLTSRVAATVTTVLLCVAFSACATPRPGSAAPTEAIDPTATATATATATPTPDDVPTPTSVPSAPPANEARTPDVDVVVITSDIAAGHVEVSGMVPRLVEDGGACTLTLSQGAVSTSVTGPTASAQESTYCSLLTYPVSGLARGAWQVTLQYASEAHFGISASQTVTVP